ncbi:hypothetical protein A0H81_01676 [Grifola frondosa]|uniref:Uncharacterized protein n=1 Tax=Grifola frondosa TaxID=5627 RepID=A0A1C7MSY4_GRIFR|nr:hypothetical protein A0H81_01676 [Grifola frondosa]
MDYHEYLDPIGRLPLNIVVPPGRRGFRLRANLITQIVAICHRYTRHQMFWVIGDRINMFLQKLVDRLTNPSAHGHVLYRTYCSTCPAMPSGSPF